MSNDPVLIAGGGIGGLAMALTLHQIGIPAIVLEGVRELKPLGVGINLQPNAVRGLLDVGISETELNEVGLPVREWALVGRNGNEIHSEPRGLEAGYNWPQYAVHRGHFHMLLYRKVLERLGSQSIRLGCRVVGYEHRPDQSVAAKIQSEDGSVLEQVGALLIGADGIHSSVRAQMHPDQPPIHWGGSLMWRGTTRAKPIRTGASFVGLGGAKQRMIIYPISQTDREGYATINWIAEISHDKPELRDSGWFRQVTLDAFMHHFEDWTFDWLNVPELLQGADVVYENPMIDRDPVDTWQDGRVVLIGDAAHAMYPTGSNGASQAIVDARVLGANLISIGVSEDALKAFDEHLCAPVSELILRNRGAGPFGLLDMIEERCNGLFDQIDDVLPKKEREAFLAKYKAAAGFAIESINNAPDSIPPDLRQS